MKALLQVLGGAFAVFLAAAFIQEWEVFGPWILGRASGDPAEPAARAAAAQDAEDAVRSFVAIVRHLHATEGDPRFAERVPASREVVAEALGEIGFLRARAQRLEPELLKLDVVRTDAVAADRVEVRTREYWVFRLFGPRGELAPARSAIVHGRYLVRLDGATWRVDGWEIERAPPPEEEG